MGQKVNPHGIRVGVIKDWGSMWYADADFADCLVEDYNIRKYLKKKLYTSGVSKIDIGADIENTKKELKKLTGKNVNVDIKEIKRPEKESQLVAENIAKQLEDRVAYRRAMKQAMTRTMKSGVYGIKVQLSGRLGGADMARTETISDGTIPLQTLRADIDYGFAEADTTYGKVGVKVWIYKGEVLPVKENKEGSAK